jgi:lysophospholipase
MGGFIVTGFGAKYPAKVNGIILTDAATADRAGILNTIPLALPPTTMLPNNLSQLICSDPAVVKAYEEDPLVAKEISVGLFKQIQEGINWLHAEGHIKDFAYPCLILHGGADQIVSPEDSKFLYESISSTDKEIKIYDGLFHEILNEKTRDNVLADINNWISERLA